MKVKYLILSALATVAAHKVRSFLTILGIVIGIAAIIAVMSIGQGATGLVLGEIERMGADTVVVVPGQIEGGGLFDLFFVEPLTQRDLDALKRPGNVPNLEQVVPAVVVPGAVGYRDRIYRQAMTTGSDAEFFTGTFGMNVELGVNFTAVDIANSERVTVIGSRIRDELFGQNDPIGEQITIADVRFRVVGVYASEGQIGPVDMDTFILIPYTTAQRYITGNDRFEEFYIKADSVDAVDRVAFDVEATLRESRAIRPGEASDFSVITQEGYQELVGTVLNILNAFLIFVVSIALVVGGIGIMNIMLVSVMERTGEIGLRKALGATRSAILKQFLWEAITLTVLGGIIGVVIGSSVSFAVSQILSGVLGMQWPFVFPIGGALLGIGMSAMVGLLFGLYPALQAARKDPIEALQYEK